MTIPDIEEFKQELRTGGARPTLFYIKCGFPGLSTSIVDNDAVSESKNAITKLSFMARAASIPEEIISPINVGYHGRKIKLSGDRTYRDWNINVINNEQYTIRQGFENWFTDLNHPSINTRVRKFVDPLGYKTDIVIDQLSQNGFTSASYKLIGAFPIRIGDIKLSWDDQNTIEDYDITFAYDYFVRIPVNIV